MTDEHTTDHTPVTRRDLHEQNIDKVFPERSRGDLVRVEHGKLEFANMTEMMNAAKMLSMATVTLPQWLRGNPGDCFVILGKALHWGFEISAVASQIYKTVSKSGVERIEHQAQLVNALILSRAKLARRPRYMFSGEGESRRCTCTVYIRGEEKPFVYESPPISQISPKNSPLWATDPDQQLAYYSIRAWAKRHSPETLMGVNSADDIVENEPLSAPAPLALAEPTAALHQRLEQAAAASNGEPGEGFSESAIEEAVREASGVNATAPGGPAEPAGEPEPGGDSRGQPEPEKRTGARPAAKAKAAKAEKPPKERPLPTSPTEYRKWVAGWLREYDDEAKIAERWRTERRLRNACGLIEEDREKVRALVDNRIADIRR